METAYKRYLPPALISLPLTALGTLLIQESLARGSLTEVANWLSSYPAPFLLNFFLHTLILSFFVALFGRFRIGMITGSLLLLFLAAINAVKIAILRAPFFTWDYLYAKQLMELGEAMLPGYNWLWVAVLFPAALFAIIYRGWRAQRSFGFGARLAIMCAVLSCSFLFYWQSGPVLNKLRIQNIVWDQSENYNENGFLLALSMNISPLFIEKPAGYGRGLVEKVLSPSGSSEKQAGLKDRPASLVIVMSESFSDLCGAPLQANIEPMENFKRLSSAYPRFSLVSPTYAGGTSLVEYEALTGLSNAFLPPGAIPYDHYIRSPIPSLAWTLRQNNYRTIAVHPFSASYWSRDIVYPNLGFDEFIALDQFEGATKRGQFVSDESLTDKMIEVIDSQTGPFMLFAVSMQNHGPYWGNRYQQNEVRISNNVSDWLRGEIESYLTGVLDADRQLERLLKYFESREEPIVFLFFGDHQPAFAARLYREMGMTKEGSESLMQLAEVPGILWANSKELLDPDAIPPRFSPAYLPPVLLHQMGIPLPDHFRYLLEGLNETPVLHRDFLCDSSGSLSKFDRKRTSPYLNGLEVLNYDVLFGSKYCWRHPPESDVLVSSACANFVTECANFVTESQTGSRF